MLTYSTSNTLNITSYHIQYYICLHIWHPTLCMVTYITSYTLYAYLHHILYSLCLLTSLPILNTLTYITSYTRYAYLHDILIHRRCFYEFRRNTVHLQYSYAFWRTQRSVSITDGVFKWSQMFKNIKMEISTFKQLDCTY
jgi:hypothetical protein